MAAAGPSGAPKPGKRNWLKKPAWLVEEQEQIKQQEEEMFRRSGDCHADILAEQERRRKKREEKAERERKAEIEKKEKQEAKRRRIMEEKKEEAKKELEEERAKHDMLRDSNIDSSPSSKPQPESKRSTATVIEIDDSEDETSHHRNYQHSATQNSDAWPPPSSSDRVLDDGQYHEQNDMGPASPGSPTTEAPSKTIDEGPNPPIFILIDPRISGTKQLLVKRFYKDNLRLVRKTWCEKQGFTPEQAQSVILTWRGRRAFDVANCKSLGIELDEDGEPVIRAGQKGYDESGSKIVLEATTEELLEQDKNAAAEAARRKVEEEWEHSDEHETVIRVLLRAKGLKELKLRVKLVCWLSNCMSFLLQNALTLS